MKIRFQSLVFSGALLCALASAGCLGHEKPYSVTPLDKVGTQSEGTGLKLGQTAPDPVLFDTKGAKVKLSSVSAGGATLLVFYRGGWCPPCNYQIHALTGRNPEFARRGVHLVGISVDDPKHAAQTQAEYKTQFPLLSDPDLAAHRAFHVIDHIGGLTTFMLARMGANLEDRSGREHHDVAVPALFLLDRDRVVRWAHTDPDYSTRPSVDQLLAVVDRTEPRLVAPPASRSPAPGETSVAVAPTTAESARPENSAAMTRPAPADPARP
jgi:peroxiredoxin